MSEVAVLNQNQSMSVFDSAAGFEQAQRMAKALASATTMVPATYQNNVPNCIVALELAYRLNQSPLMVMQNVSIIHGKSSLDSKFVIALANQSGRFLDPLDFDVQGEGDSRTCRAFTRRKDGTKIVGPEVSIKMAIDEGWMGKSGSKWKTMPELMLQYRAATFFGRLHCPDVLMGMQTADEITDIGFVEETLQKSATISHINNEVAPEVKKEDDHPFEDLAEEKPEATQEQSSETEKPAETPANDSAAVSEEDEDEDF